MKTAKRVNIKCSHHTHIHGFPGGSEWRICLQCRRSGFSPWVWKIPWRREWLPSPVFLPGEFHGQSRTLVGYSPWGHKELNMAKQLSILSYTHTHTHTHTQTIMSMMNVLIILLWQSFSNTDSYQILITLNLYNILIISQ